MTKQTFRKIITTAWILLSLSLCSFLFACGKNEPNLYTVMLPCGEGYTVQGDPIVQAKHGDSVSFDVTLGDGYTFVNSNVGRFADGKLTVENVEYSVTIELTARLSQSIASIENGTVTVTNSADGGAPIYGEYADFHFTPNDNYVLEELYVNDCAYDLIRRPDGSVTVTEIFDAFVSTRAVCLGKECTISTAPVENGVLTVSQTGTVRYGDTIEIECTPADNFKLAYLDLNGNREYNTPSRFTYTIGGDTLISALFIDYTYPSLRYDYNGARYTALNEIIEWAQAGSNVYLENGYGVWEYEGYTLESWNTKADGSGERHALGAMIPMPATDCVLYAQFKVQTPTDCFTFAPYEGVYGDGYEITGIVDLPKNTAELVLPDEYAGKPVLAVAADAFRGESGITTVITQAQIEKIGDFAFADMPDLSEVCLFDRLRTFGEHALTGSPAVNRIHINSASRRIYDRILETNLVDKHMLVKTSARKKIVTISGCSLSKGMHSQMFAETEYFKDYDIIHMGVHARYGLGLLMDLVNDYLNPDDILIIALENYDYLWFTEAGMAAIYPTRLQHFESNYDVYDEFDFVESGARNPIVRDLPAYFAQRAKDLDNDVHYNPSPNRYDMNEYGDYTYFRPNATSLGETIDTLFPEMRFLSGVEIINAWAQPHIDRGVRIGFMFPPVYRYQAYDEPANTDVRERFQAQLKRDLAFPVLNTIDDASLPMYCFSDWINHPSTEGTFVYTERFIQALTDAVKDGAL